MLAGARQGRGTFVRRLIAVATSRDLRVLVLPGPEVAWMQGLNLRDAGLQLAATPRHANVLLVIGPLPSRLCQAAAILYAQMVRPRAILALGADTSQPLPPADIRAVLSPTGLLDGISRLRQALATGAFSPDTSDFDADVLHGDVKYVCPRHPEIVRDAPGDCPKCGMQLEARDQSGVDSADSEHSHAGHGGHQQNLDASESADPPGSDSHDRKHGEAAAHPDQEDPDTQGHARHSDGNASDHHDANHDHSDMDFMSMVEVTRDLPRSRDGLAMDWMDVPFGPFFPGLPGGLELQLTLDGDGVARGRATYPQEGSLCRDHHPDVTRFVGQFSATMRSAPVAFGLLACLAIDQAAGYRPDAPTTRARLGALERERVASHLGWLALSGQQVGLDWLTHAATRLQGDVLNADVERLKTLRPALEALRRRIARTPLLKAQLAGIGVTGTGTLRGPVARAAGQLQDLRLAEDIYGDLGFEPACGQGADAYARWQVRLQEIIQSLDLVTSLGAIRLPAAPDGVGDLSGTGQAAVETPRGQAHLRVSLDRGRVTAVELDSPSRHHYDLVPALVEHQELGDAVVAVGSLDLSPWEKQP